MSSMESCHREVPPSSTSSTSMKHPRFSHTSPQFSSIASFQVVDPMDPMLLERIRGAGKLARETRRESNMSTSTIHSAISAMSTASSQRAAYQASQSGSTPCSPAPPNIDPHARTLASQLRPTPVVKSDSSLELKKLVATYGMSYAKVLLDSQFQPGSSSSASGVPTVARTPQELEQTSMAAKISALLQTQQLQNDEEEALARLLLQNKLKEQQLHEYKKALEREEQMALRQFLQQRTLARERAFKQKKLELERQFLEQQRQDENSQLLQLLLEKERQKERRQSVHSSESLLQSRARLEGLFPVRTTAAAQPRVPAADPTLAQPSHTQTLSAAISPLSHKVSPLSSSPAHIALNIGIQQPTSGGGATPNPEQQQRQHQQRRFSLMSPSVPSPSTSPMNSRQAATPAAAVAVTMKQQPVANGCGSQLPPAVSSAALADSHELDPASLSSLYSRLCDISKSESSSSLKLLDNLSSLTKHNELPSVAIPIPPRVSVPTNEPWAPQVAESPALKRELGLGLSRAEVAHLNHDGAFDRVLDSTSRADHLNSIHRVLSQASLNLNPQTESTNLQQLIPALHPRSEPQPGSPGHKDHHAFAAQISSATAEEPQFAVPAVTPRATTHTHTTVAAASPSTSKRSSTSADLVTRSRASSYSTSRSFSRSHRFNGFKDKEAMFSLDSAMMVRMRSSSHSDLGRLLDSPSASGASASGSGVGSASGVSPAAIGVGVGVGGIEGDAMTTPSNLSLLDHSTTFGTMGAMGDASALTNAEVTSML